MQMIPVQSSAISAVGFDAFTQRMKIRFLEGGTYTFCGVPAHIFEGFLAASSKGRFYDRHIRGRYQC